jgi:FlaA1/EpsC-like NDP-sugar epimerase
MNRVRSFIVLDPVVLLLISLISLFLATGDTTNGVLYAFVFLGPIIAFSFQQRLWRYASIDDVWDFVKVISPFVVSIPVLWFLDFLEPTYLIIGGLSVTYLFVSRFGLRLIGAKIQPLSSNRVLIYGAGDGGDLAFKELSLKKTIVAFVDDDETKQVYRLHGKRIYPSSAIPALIKGLSINEVVIAIPSLSRITLVQLAAKMLSYGVKVSTMSLLEEMNHDASRLKTQAIKIEDVLGRAPLAFLDSDISKHVENQVVLITGAGGSIGSELARQLAKYSVKQLILLDQFENNLYTLDQSLRRYYPAKADVFLPLIASVQDALRIDEIIQTYQPNIIFHAAAHKHVPLMESSPQEAIKNNVFGSFHVMQAAIKHQVPQVVVISTDKAVNPTNIMGATKRVVEIMMQLFAATSATTVLSAVRFGNVLGSQGSVVPLFEAQIAAGGPVTITDPEIKRYFMTIPEACQLILQSSLDASSGDIFVLDMGEPIKIIDLANQMIRLAGFEPGVDIQIQTVGLRPGEKMFEELLLDASNVTSTKRDKIYVEHPMTHDVSLHQLLDMNYVQSMVQSIIQGNQSDET